MYNSALSFTSIGAKINQQITGTSGIYTFRIHRKMYHRIGSLLPNSETHGELQQITKDPQCYNTPNAAIMIGNRQEIEHQN
ncbi:hypothetical protein RhiirA1_475706 [Rhizophagus irregularis]|uniref:Uncharacterized protein n=1 Tax=Rhizophagus irregularis TaxID=588596 RepID=A0A2I1FJP3_9GLOM|nr:hypothetical protein RhiirA1_475706 [Rhizophagus irregularis]PKY34587.1 hypothetical protein RhiirB3_454437 [Rhizophagus irregularis]